MTMPLTILKKVDQCEEFTELRQYLIKRVTVTVTNMFKDDMEDLIAFFSMKEDSIKQEEKEERDDKKKNRLKEYLRVIRLSRVKRYTQFPILW